MVDNFDSNFLAMSCRPEFMNMLVSQSFGKMIGTPMGYDRSTAKKASFRNRKICKKTGKNLVKLSQSKQKFPTGHRIRRLDTVVGRGRKCVEAK